MPYIAALFAHLIKMFHFEQHFWIHTRRIGQAEDDHSSSIDISEIQAFAHLKAEYELLIFIYSCHH